MTSDADISSFMNLVLRIDAKAMAADGHPFFLSENGVWLTDSVPTAFLSRIDPKVEA
jgi:RNA:NAD 2'-phosphotransferase (TPT1/KptA family)